jgi:alanine dehydrogenase
MLILSNEDAVELLTMRDCIAALEAAYVELAHNRAASALRTDAVTTTGRPDAIYSLKLMGGVLASAGVGCVRLNSDIISFGADRQVKLPLAPGNRYTGLVMLFSSETGEPLAIFPDGVLQRLRVGATSAIAARYLARPGAKQVALIGAGWQAGAQVMAIAATHAPVEIRCYSPTKDKRDAFCAEMTALTGVPVRPFDTPEAAVKGAEIVLCATNTTRHVFYGRWLEPGMHVATIRGPELELAVLQRSKLVAVHDRSARPSISVTEGVNMPGGRHEIKGYSLDAAPTLAELVAGTAKGRTSPDDITTFINLPGLGLQFAAVGAAFYRKAKAAGRGHKLPTEWFTEDVVP